MFQTQSFSFTNLPQNLSQFPSQPFPLSPSNSTHSYPLPTPSPSSSSLLSPYKTSIDSLEIYDNDFPTPSPTNLQQRSFSLNMASKKITKKAKENSPCTSKSMGISVDSPKKRSPWSAAEDAQLVELISIHGRVWAKVASMMGSRTGKQVRDRFLNVLAANIKKGPWTEAEDQKIWVLHKQLGAHWCKIAAHMEGRTEIQVKNRFYTHLKRNPEFYEARTEFVTINLELSSHSRTVSTNSNESLTQASDPTDMISYQDSEEQNDFWRNGNFDFLNF